MEALGWERRLGPALLVVLLALGALVSLPCAAGVCSRPAGGLSLPLALLPCKNIANTVRRRGEETAALPPCSTGRPQGAAWGGGRGTAAARRVALALTGHHHLGEGSWPINLTGPYEWLHIPKAGVPWAPCPAPRAAAGPREAAVHRRRSHKEHPPSCLAGQPFCLPPMFYRPHRLATARATHIGAPQWRISRRAGKRPPGSVLRRHCALQARPGATCWSFGPARSWRRASGSPRAEPRACRSPAASASARLAAGPGAALGRTTPWSTAQTTSCASAWGGRWA